MGHGVFQIEDGEGVAAEVFIYGLQLRQSQLIQRLAGFFGQRHDGANDVMGLPKGNAFAHEIVSEIRGEQCGVARGRLAGSAVYFRVFQHRGSKAHGRAHRIDGIEQALFVFLQIAIVGHRQALEQGQQRNQIADNTAGFATREFGDVRIFLLRHQGRAGRVRVVVRTGRRVPPSPADHPDRSTIDALSDQEIEYDLEFVHDDSGRAAVEDEDYKIVERPRGVVKKLPRRGP